MYKKGNTKIVVIVIVVVAVIAIAYFAMKNKAVAPADNTAATANAKPNQASVAQAPLDTSDASIEKDATTVDASLKALETDSASVDQSLNDKAVDQIQL